MGNPARPLEEVPAERAGPALHAVTTLPMPLSRPETELEHGNASLNAVARRIGGSLRTACEKTHQLKTRSMQLREQLTVIRTQAQEKPLTAVAAEWKRIGAEKAVRFRDRALQIADENPLYVIAGAAAAAFVLGFALQIRRSNHARG